MALDIANPEHSQRSFGFVLLGMLLLVCAALLFYDLGHTSDATPVSPTGYDYTVNQAVDTGVSYFNSSFYDKGPAANNTAYVADLTDEVKATLHYKYHSARPVELTTLYGATATVRYQYMFGADSKDISTVWSKEYSLIKPVTSVVTTSDLAFDPSVSIPFADYRKMAYQMKQALSLPATSEVTIAFTVHVSGSIDGTRFDDIRVATVTMPLDQPIYRFATKFEKEDKKQVVTQAMKSGQDTTKNYERIIMGILTAFGLMAIVYGMRKQIFKSAYQRELEKIYRYHDGIIIRASQPAAIAGKTMVPVQTFDDMLNLEEELKVPIVATPAGSEATRFLIVRDDIVYVYTLGKVLLDDIPTSIDEEPIEETHTKKHDTKRR